ncbi:ABC-2 type transport system permease protein [Hathewaya proteolytica DSM 3090]|uniref:Transport permease protein n=1 Tax=Hathewaya proteolytica DSM 3090 TaxID=1121331 RepID=A0A1M6K536_9CLOT|nr:ABC transporter permease [Hathewaya proteolytica]SHJ54043.1 ABC-2 type transport system permease protein [Hathewaya proteolytica DSM 3090]
MNVTIATFKKNRREILRATPISFIFSRIVTGFFAIVLPYCIYNFFMKGSLTSEFQEYTNNADYMTYIVLGSALNVLAVATLMNIGRALITEQRQGTLEPFIITSASRIQYFLGCFLEQFSRAIMEFGVILIVGYIFGAHLGRLFCLDSVITILLAVFAFFCLGLTLSSIMLHTRDTFITQNTLFNLMTLCCAVFYPVEYLPKIIQYISQLFPLRHAVELFRRVVIGGETVLNNSELAIRIIILSIIYFTVGYFWYRHIEKTLVEQIFS